MRRLAMSPLVLACSSAAMMGVFVLGVQTALADNGPHVAGMGATTERCSACHRAHTAQAPHLLKESSEEALCYTCHGSAAGGSDLDAKDGIGYAGASTGGTEHSGSSGALRGGGFQYALIDSSKPKGTYVSGRLVSGEIPALGTGAPVTSAHTVDSSSQTAWGNGAISATASFGKTLSLRCGSCHDPHGNGDYRILRPIPQESGATPEVKIPDVAAKEYLTVNYWQSWEPNNPQFRYQISSWCATCHTRLLSKEGEKSGSTNSGDAVFTYRHRSYFTQAEYEAIEKESSTKTKPSCIQCHVAHGSNASMSGYATTINYPNGGAAGSDSFLLRADNRGVCQMCHNK